MDAVLDVSARAVSFIVLIQDTFLSGALFSGDTLVPENNIISDDFTDKFRNYIIILIKHEKDKNIRQAALPGEEIRPAGITNKIIELVWVSGKLLSEEDTTNAELYVIQLCTTFVKWISKNVESLKKSVDRLDEFSPPDVWREAINYVIYSDAEQRVALAQSLEYLPIHIVLALGGCEYDQSQQRILQWWPKNTGGIRPTLTEKEKRFHEQFKKIVHDKFNPGNEEFIEGSNVFYDYKIKEFLIDYKKLIQELLKVNAPLSFEYIYNLELDEIIQARKLRANELAISYHGSDENQQSSTKKPINENVNNTDNNSSSATVNNCDQLLRASQLKLFAIAFSGGGIRSATFNLGILQGLAKQGIISQVDYLSAVSGGGYITSWLASWIKREGSVRKVTDRLNPEKSPDPFSEEVRPIRWLRMFSNYFAPNKSIMSVDAWTIGVTWLRNTVLNQVVIFLILLSSLFLVTSLFLLWQDEPFWKGIYTGTPVYVTTCILMLLFGFLTGLGMQWYNKGRVTYLPFNLNNTEKITFIIILEALVGAYVISASLFSHDVPSFWERLYILWPAGLIMFIILLVIAYLGRYEKCIKSFNRKNGNFRSTAILVYTALIASSIGLLSLSECWKLIDLIRHTGHMRRFTSISNGIKFSTGIAFTIGLPMILIVLGITVVARMALLGKYFPDERREWWGRMGAVINRIVFVWILLTASVLLIRGIIVQLPHKWAPTTLGGWLLLLGSTVKAAFSSKTSGKEETKGFQAAILEILSKAAPYIFIGGLLIFLPVFVKLLMDNLVLCSFIGCSPPYLKAFLLAVLLFVPGLYLSSRLGVNEFSMHHFYRNRLVRAYLGATRPKASREKTSNPFTGFDNLDDAKLSKFTHEKGYFGPFPILNTTLNASQFSGAHRQDRKAESFIFSPLYCGFDFSKIVASVNSQFKSYDYGYRPTQLYAYPNDDGPGIGTAMAISGAAVNPNQGYHSSTATAFLLTVFNIQLGWWIGNPRKSKWQESDPAFGLGYLFANLTGQTSTKNQFVCLSDGGHFDNMGLYELIRRRCKFIVLGDSEQDENFTCEGFANAIRLCRIDFGAEINIKIDDIIKRENGHSKAHYSLGNIKYAGETEPSGKLLYIKSSITGDESVDITEYASQHKTFPHQTTADQFFDERQFESYRKLGLHIADGITADRQVIKDLELKFVGKSKAQSPVKDEAAPLKNLFTVLKDFFTKKG